MPYWVFENRTVKDKSVIHRGDCPDCTGRREFSDHPREGASGRWHGPFETVNAAVQAAISTGRPVSQHDCTR